MNDWLSRRRILTPDREAVVDGSSGQRYCYAELDTRATLLAGHLRDRFGIEPRDRVACLLSNRIEYFDLYFACGKLGAILVPINFRLSASEIGELVEDSTPKLLVYERNFVHLICEKQFDNDEVESWDIDVEAAPGNAIALRALKKIFKPFVAEETDVAMILFTSGTEGRAKGAMISYRQIHWNALNTTIGLQLTADDVAFANMPLYHTGGWHVLFTPLMLLGGRVVLQPKFDATRCNSLLGLEGITILFGVPTTLRMMADADNFTTADLSRIRFAIFGGESCPAQLIETYAARGIAMRQGYGLTEAGPNCFSLPAADATRKPGSIGFPNFFVDVRLCGDDGTEVPVGQVGELQIRGPHLFAGYWNDPEATAKVLVNGWFATGDMMLKDEEGYFYVVGRKKEMYISGGENVYPSQTERVLQRHPAVKSAAVIGVSDAKWGEVGWAFVQTHTGVTANEAELLDWCSQHLARFQCPARISIVEELPLGPSGKIDKRLLAERSNS